MKLSEIKKHLATTQSVNFKLPNDKFVPENFHVTEVGIVTKNFIDCGGVVRKEEVVNFQLWDADDFDHRLKAQKLLDIIALSERILSMTDLEIEVEYQSETIGKYGLDHDGTDFLLLYKQTACLAQETCDVTTKTKVDMQILVKNSSVCEPGSNCC